ncbi:hypothetical protein BJ508DRAFT_418020 [Ascobolus immersus RN42]|uniref:Uncharacterized protein n=1 Tax=Ascobolus immersus RN42 TaxID=1160509 RepID=A0A3N4HP52_ASCIM|nr:hypothetical protein BJ508DRAFT_418020 [Ascobolus immersus RN42]
MAAAMAEQRMEVSLNPGTFRTLGGNILRSEEDIEHDALDFTKENPGAYYDNFYLDRCEMEWNSADVATDPENKRDQKIGKVLVGPGVAPGWNGHEQNVDYKTWTLEQRPNPWFKAPYPKHIDFVTLVFKNWCVVESWKPVSEKSPLVEFILRVTLVHPDDLAVVDALRKTKLKKKLSVGPLTKVKYVLKTVVIELPHTPPLDCVRLSFLRFMDDSVENRGGFSLGKATIHMKWITFNERYYRGKRQVEEKRVADARALGIKPHKLNTEKHQVWLLVLLHRMEMK